MRPRRRPPRARGLARASLVRGRRETSHAGPPGTRQAEWLSHLGWNSALTPFGGIRLPKACAKTGWTYRLRPTTL
jgi:hypothetical protein